jgi:methylenetetrahydrofolate reductase (NADPH)
LPYKPTEILEGLAAYKLKDPDLNIEQVHFFPIGGVKQTADFAREIS